jgi:hypothetical protein
MGNAKELILIYAAFFVPIFLLSYLLQALR